MNMELGSISEAGIEHESENGRLEVRGVHAVALVVVLAVVVL